MELVRPVDHRKEPLLASSHRRLLVSSFLDFVVVVVVVVFVVVFVFVVVVIVVIVIVVVVVHSRNLTLKFC